jgi:hypothetical protein
MTIDPEPQPAGAHVDRLTLVLWPKGVTSGRLLA